MSDRFERGPGGYGFALPEDPAKRDQLAMLGQLAGGLTHELKNPLGALDLTVGMLREQLSAAVAGADLDADKALRRVERLVACSAHLRAIVEDFLSFARPTRPDLERVDVNRLLAELVEGQQELLAADAVTVHWHLQADLYAVAGDPTQLRSVFLNILLNARDALRQRSADRRIVVLTRNRGDGVSILFGNNGPPLSARAASHLFDPFFSEKEGGTGLGLAIVHRLVELHHGSVSVQSDPSQGVTFTIELPTRLGPARPRQQLPMPDAEAVVSAAEDGAAVVPAVVEKPEP